MKVPEKHENEVMRLAALESLCILDTPVEERFDRLTRLACRLFDVPIALVSLIDSKRQWFKSRQGLLAKETSSEISFCGHAILGNRIFEISDALLDERFYDNPLVVGDPYIRFYAGAPLTTADGYNLGTLCIIDTKPRQLSVEDHVSLRDLADTVEQEINQTLLREKTLTLQKAQLLAGIISRFQSEFIREDSRHKAFAQLLRDLLEVTDTEYGFVGDVQRDESGRPCLKAYVFSATSCAHDTPACFDQDSSDDLLFGNLESLFGSEIVAGQPVFLNDPQYDPRSDALPGGFPPLMSFLGLPCYHDGELVAMLGLANRSLSYEKSVVDFVQPLLVTIGQLISASRIRKMHEAVQAEFARLSMVVRQTNNGVVIINRQRTIQWVNDSFIRFSGQAAKDLQQCTLDQFLRLQQVGPDVVAEMLSDLALGKPFQKEFCVDRSGQTEWLRVNWDPYYSDSGMDEESDGVPYAGFIGLFSIITREKLDAQKLHESEQQFRSLVNNIPGITYRCLFDEHWTMLYMSDQVDPLSGYSASDFIQNAVRSYASVIHVSDRGHASRVVEEALAAGTDWIVEYRIMHRDGSVRWAMERGSAVRDEEGRVLFLDGFILDVTEEKQSKVRLQALFEMSPIGIALNDFDTGAFIDVNDAMVRPSGYTRDEFMSLSYWDLTPKEFEEQEQQQLENMHSTGRYGPYEKEYIRKNGTRYPVMLNGMVVYEASGRKLIWSIVEDISERKRVERMKSEFISTVSHELRTPLTAISGALGLVVGGVLGETSGKMHDLLLIAHKNSLRLHMLINDLLDMEKLVAGKMRFDMQVQPLKPLLERSLKENQIYADQYDVCLALDSPEIEVNVDAHRLQQVLANLLSNAVKFSPAGATVSVSVVQHETSVRVQIRDRGPGIPKSFHSSIFEKFAQADGSDARERSGTGLGLAITRELVERMDGRIGFDSVQGEGTTFWFDLPMATPKAS